MLFLSHTHSQPMGTVRVRCLAQGALEPAWMGIQTGSLRRCCHKPDSTEQLSGPEDGNGIDANVSVTDVAYSLP